MSTLAQRPHLPHVRIRPRVRQLAAGLTRVVHKHAEALIVVGATLVFIAVIAAVGYLILVAQLHHH